jgi:hypothetical protein
MAIAVEPYVHRPCQSTSGSNFMANAYENVSVVVEACALFGLIAKEHKMLRKPNSSRDALTLLYDEMTLWIEYERDKDNNNNNNNSDADDPRQRRLVACHLYCATALCLINVIYPTKWSVGDTMLLEGIAFAIPLLQKKIDSYDSSARSYLADLLQEEDYDEYDHDKNKMQSRLEEVRKYWSSFTRSEHLSAWPAVRDLAKQILNDNGNHTATLDDARHMREILVKCLQNAWLVHSIDGSRPSAYGPVKNVPTPSCVHGAHLAPVFFTTAGKDTRGGLCGMQRFQFRQVLALLLAESLPERVQVYRNEGALCARSCAAADLCRPSGEIRARKGYSALQTDSDKLGFGCLKSKLIATARQREAFDKNTTLCIPLIARLQCPNTHEERWKGDTVDGGRSSSISDTSVGVLTSSSSSGPLSSSSQMKLKGIEAYLKSATTTTSEDSRRSIDTNIMEAEIATQSKQNVLKVRCSFLSFVNY